MKKDELLTEYMVWRWMSGFVLFLAIAYAQRILTLEGDQVFTKIWENSFISFVVCISISISLYIYSSRMHKKWKHSGDREKSEIELESKKQ